MILINAGCSAVKEIPLACIAGITTIVPGVTKGIGALSQLCWNTLQTHPLKIAGAITGAVVVLGVVGVKREQKRINQTMHDYYQNTIVQVANAVAVVRRRMFG